MPTNKAKPARTHPAVWIVMAAATAFGAALGLTGAGPSNMPTIAYWAGAAGLVLILISIHVGRRREK